MCFILLDVCLRRPGEIPFTVPPRLTARNRDDRASEETEAPRDVLGHRGSLSVQSRSPAFYSGTTFLGRELMGDFLGSTSGWYPVGTVLAGLYSAAPLGQVAPAPPRGLATRLCFSVEYRHSSEQLTVSLLRLANLPPRFHGNATLVELRRLPDDRRPRQAKARGTGPDPEFSDCFIFQVKVWLLTVCLSLFASIRLAR